MVFVLFHVFHTGMPKSSSKVQVVLNNMTTTTHNRQRHDVLISISTQKAKSTAATNIIVTPPHELVQPHPQNEQQQQPKTISINVDVAQQGSAYHLHSCVK